MKSSNHAKYDHQNPLQQMLIQRFLKEIVNFYKEVKPEKMLDAGCGEGFVLDYLRRKGGLKTASGIDLSESAVAIAKKTLPSFDIREGSIFEIPYKDNSFDLVLCTEVLEHLNKPQNAVKEILRVSKKYVIFSVPNEPWFCIANIVRGKNLTRLGNDVEHINHWSHWAFRKFISSKGVRVIQSKTVFPWTLVLAEKEAA